MRRQSIYTLINILGLAIGMAACILILLFVRHETSYDTFHEKGDRIYRVSREWFNEDGNTSLHLGHCAPPFAPLLKNDFEGTVEEAVRILRGYNSLLIYGEKQFEEENFFFAEAAFFDVFTYPFLQGNPQTALQEPNALVITESTAKKYFGEEDPMGKTISYQHQADLKVTGVMKDVPDNSHVHMDFLASFQTVENFFGRENMMNNWGSNNYGTYVLLKEGYDPEDLAAQLPAFLDKHLGEWKGVPASTFNQLNLWPIRDIHLHSHLDSEIEANGDIAYVYIFSIIAFLILIIACINFINLATAKASKRAKEVGLRKVVGAFRGMIVRQFMTESILMSVFAMALGLVFAYLFLPFLNQFMFDNLELTLTSSENRFIVPLICGLTMFVGIVAGSYPAFYLSSFSPLKTLRGGSMGTSHKSILRSTLVVVQFAISIALIIGVGIIQHQLAYVRSKPLGFNKENIVSLPSSDEIYESYDRLKERLLAHPGITDVSISSRVPSGRLLDSQGGKAEVNGEMKDLDTRVADIHVSHEYFQSYQIPLEAGRFFDVNLPTDSANSFILNESAVRAIGWDSSDEAIGKEFHYGDREGNIVGVIKDFHFENLRQSIIPMVFLITQGRASEVSIRMHRAAQDEVMSFLEQEWAYLRPGYPFTYDFIDENFSVQYEVEDRLARLITYFSVLAIIIAALGLFGLASFTSEQRFKEIGIRKVLGAKVSEIWFLLTSKFTLLVLIAFPLGAIGAYFLMDTWLDNFAYRTSISIWPFITAGIISLFIAWLTVSYQSLKAAVIDPVEVIRYE